MTGPDESEVEGLTEVTVPANIEQEDLIRHVRVVYALVGFSTEGDIHQGRRADELREIIKEAFDAAERWEDATNE